MQPRPAAVNLFSVRRELIADFEGTLSRIADMGYRGVEPALFGPVALDLLPEDMRIEWPEPEALAAMLDRVGLETASLHAPLPIGPMAGYVFDYARALRTDQLVLASFLALPEAANAHADAGALAIAIERFGEACAAAAAQGLRVGFHNHTFEWAHPLEGDRVAWDLFWERVDPRVCAEVDVYWAACAGQDPAAVIERLGPRVRRIHLKDGPCTPDAPQVALGRGRVDLEACVEAARHVDWHIVELDDCASDMLEALAQSLDFLVERGFSTRR